MHCSAWALTVIIERGSESPTQNSQGRAVGESLQEKNKVDLGMQLSLSACSSAAHGMDALLGGAGEPESKQQNMQWEASGFEHSGLSAVSGATATDFPPRLVMIKIQTLFTSGI